MKGLGRHGNGEGMWVVHFPHQGVFGGVEGGEGMGVAHLPHLDVCGGRHGWWGTVGGWVSVRETSFNGHFTKRLF